MERRTGLSTYSRSYSTCMLLLVPCCDLTETMERRTGLSTYSRSYSTCMLLLVPCLDRDNGEEDRPEYLQQKLLNLYVVTCAMT